MSDKKLHWFSFVYICKDAKSGQDVTASTYTGYKTKNITVKIVAENKENAGVTDEAVLIDLPYLGYMTKAELLGE